MQRKLKFIMLLTVCLTTILSVFFSADAAGHSIEFGDGEVVLISAPGAKGGVSASLSPVSTYSGSDYKETRYDSSLRLSISEQSWSTVSNTVLNFHYSNASNGNGEFILALLLNSADEILYYSRVAAPSSSSGSFSVSLPLLSSGAYYLRFFPERAGAEYDIAGSGDYVSLNILEDPYITTTSLPQSTIGVSYNTTLSASTTSSTISWSIVSGSLPTGLSLDASTGKISGTPTVADTFNFTVRATGSTYSERDFSITINPEISISFTADGLSGSAITIPKGKMITLVAAISGGTKPYDVYSWQINGSTVPGNSTSSITVDSSKIGTTRYTFSLIDHALANRSASVDVTVREPIMPTVGTVSFVFDKAAPSPVTFTKSDGDFNFSGRLEHTSGALLPGSDFILAGNTITISESYLSNLSYGAQTIKTDYDDVTADPSITVTVIDSSKPPIVGDIVEPSPYNRGSNLSISIPSVQTFGVSATSQGWKIRKADTADFVDFDTSAPLDCVFNNAEVYYYATNVAGTDTSNTVKITVNHHGATVWNKDSTHHWHVCACGEKYDLEPHKSTAVGDCTVCSHHCNHSYGNYTSDNNATCTSDGTKSRICVNCGHKDSITETGTKKGHTLSTWQVGETSHWHVCTTCGVRSDEASHSGGKATCTDRAVCSVCDAEYGGLADHIYNKRITDDKYLASPATETEKAKYYYSCECSAIGTETFSACDNGQHVFTQKSMTTDYLASDATCVSRAKYYYSCEECGTIGQETFEYGGFMPHTPGLEPTYTSAQTCTVCGIELKPMLDKIILTVDDSDKYNGGTTGITFHSPENIKVHDRVTIDDVELDPDEYEISEDGKTIIINPSAIDLILPEVSHTIKVYVENGIAEGIFTIYPETPDIAVNRYLPFWFYYIPPHFVGYLYGFIVILVVISRRKNEDDDEIGEQ